MVLISGRVTDGVGNFTMRLSHAFSLVSRCEEYWPIVDAQSRSMLIFRRTVETFITAPDRTIPINVASGLPAKRGGSCPREVKKNSRNIV